MDEQFLQIEKNLNAKSKIKRYKAILAWYYAHLINFEKQNLLLYWNKTTYIKSKNYFSQQKLHPKATRTFLNQRRTRKQMPC